MSFRRMLVTRVLWVFAGLAGAVPAGRCPGSRPQNTNRSGCGTLRSGAMQVSNRPVSLYAPWATLVVSRAVITGGSPRLRGADRQGQAGLARATGRRAPTGEQDSVIRRVRFHPRAASRPPASRYRSHERQALPQHWLTVGVDLDAVDMPRQRRQQGRHVAAAGSHLEHPVGFPERELLEQPASSFGASITSPWPIGISMSTKASNRYCGERTPRA